MKRFFVPTNPTRLAKSVAVRAARSGVITHKVIKPAAGGMRTLTKLFHPATKV